VTGPLINGSTRVLGVIGDPIAQVRAPGVWTALFERNGVNAVCIPLHIQSAGLPALFAALQTVRNVLGVIVTIPHKPAILHLVDEATDRARRVGAVNVVRIDEGGRTSGDILDGEGFVAGLRAGGQQIAGRRALVVGSGGVGSAIAFALAGASVREVAVSDVLPDRARQLVARLTAAGYPARVSAPDAYGFDLVVNASPAGMRPGDPLPVDCTRLDSEAIVGDVVVAAGLTPLLTLARGRGCFVQPGSVMSDHQVTDMVKFFGLPAGDWSPEAIAQAIATCGRPAGAHCDGRQSASPGYVGR
jgi:shikimate dehydrogenase